MLAVDDRLGRYRILQLLGRGGMAEVYLASVIGAAGFEKPVALKLLPPEFGRNKDRTRHLLREALIGVRLDTEHVVQILDLGEHEGRYFIAMEYIRGFTLAHVISHALAHEERTPPFAMVHVARAVVGALDYVHKVRDPQGKTRGLAHRDVSPANVLLSIDGRIKLSDFGVASLVADDIGPSAVAGKPPYLPPEAFDGARPTQGWDLYALGIVLYEALAGRRAFNGTTTAEIGPQVKKGPEPLARARPDLSHELIGVVDRAIHLDPNRRFASAAELRIALDQAQPRSVDDGDRFRDHVQGLYARESFVGQHGMLPSTSELDNTIRHEDGDIQLWVSDPAPALAALRFAMSPALGPKLARSHGDRLSARLEKATGRPVRPVVVGDYRALVDLLVAGEADFAWMPPAAFVDAADRGATVLMMAQRHGRTSYESAFIVHDDSSLFELADLRGRGLAWVDVDSAAGYLFALAEVIRELGPPEEVLKRQHFHGSHRAVCEAVASGWADAGATYVVRDDHGRIRASGWTDLMGPRAAELRAIAFSRPIPGDNIACRPGLPEATADLLARALDELCSDDEGQAILTEMFNAERLVRTDEKLYEQVRVTLKLVEGARQRSSDVTP